MNNKETISEIPKNQPFCCVEGILYELPQQDEKSIFYISGASEKDMKFHLCYLEMARRWGKNSYAKRKQVGCLIVKDKMIISDGYNGTPAGFSNECETPEGSTHPWVLHAESNAIAKVAKSSNNCDGSTIYINLSPCLDCVKLMIQSGIKRIVFSELYRDLSPLELLEKANIDYFYIPLKDE